MRTATRHALLVAAVAVLAVPLGIATGMLGTEAGRAVVVTTVLSSVNGAIPGRVAVDSVRGSPWRGMQVMGIRVWTPEGAPVVEVRSLELRYGLPDLLSGRVVLGRLAVRDVQVELVQPTSGAPFTLAAAFAAPDTAPSSEGARPPLLAFRNVSLENVTVTIRTPAGPADTAVRVEDGLRVRQIGPLTAELPYMRVSDPAAPDGPMLFEFAALSVPVSDPELTIVDLEGRAALWGDSVTLDLPRAELRGTTAELTGAIFWPGGPVQLALAGRATAFHTDDLRGLSPALPAGLAGTGVVRLTSLGADELLVEADSLDLEGSGGGG